MIDFNSKISQEEDWDAVKKCLDGDLNAFSVLEKKYKKIISSLIRKMVKDNEDVLDLTQETFIKAYNALSTFRIGCSFSSWVYRIASNNCIDFLRKKRFQTISINQPLNKSDDDYYIDIEDPSNRPDNNYLAEERMKAINEAIKKLPDNYKDIIRLRHEEDMDYNDISIHLNIPIGTVKAHLFRARKLLYEELKNNKQLFYEI